jgi:hypothetical protein
MMPISGKPEIGGRNPSSDSRLATPLVGFAALNPPYESIFCFQWFQVVFAQA